MTTAAEALVRDCANRLDQLFRQDYTMREVEAELRRLLRAALAQPQTSKPAFWARLLNGELDDRSDYCVASDPNDLGDGDEEPGITIVPVYLDPPRIGNGIEPRGCPTPGACSCIAAQSAAPAQEPFSWCVVDEDCDVMIGFRHKSAANDHLNEALMNEEECLRDAAKAWRVVPVYAAPQPAQAEEEQCGSAKSLS